MQDAHLVLRDDQDGHTGIILCILSCAEAGAHTCSITNMHGHSSGLRNSVSADFSSMIYSDSHCRLAPRFCYRAVILMLATASPCDVSGMPNATLCNLRLMLLLLLPLLLLTLHD